MRMSRDQLAFSFEEPAPAPYTLTCADVMDWARTYSGAPFSCTLADPIFAR